MANAIELPNRRVAKAPGRLSRALTRLTMKQAIVVASDVLADRYRLIAFEGAALKNVAWTPGQKMQIAMGSAFTARTYTPTEWNASLGRASLLAYAHGAGPGSDWTLGAQPGSEFRFFGPRSPLDARRMTGPLALFGDETSIGLAYAMASQDRSRHITLRFEVGDVAGGREVVTQLGLDHAVLIAKSGDDSHLAEMEAVLPALAADGASFLLTGRAATVQRLRQRLMRLAVPSIRITAKAYWAPGKTGLD